MSDKDLLNDQKINYLTVALADTQELIRFIDAKTAIVVTIIGAYIIGAFSVLDKIVIYCDKFSWYFWLVFICFCILLISSIIITARIFKPTDNPSDNIKIDGNEKKMITRVPFYIAPNVYNNRWQILFKNDKKYKLKQNFSGLKDNLKKADSDELIDSLTFELLKVSFIRNIKNDRFNYLIITIILTTILFLGFYIVYSHELFLIKLKSCSSK